MTKNVIANGKQCCAVEAVIQSVQRMGNVRNVPSSDSSVPAGHLNGSSMQKKQGSAVYYL